MNEEELIARYIEPNPYRSGPDEALIAGTGVPVWAIIARTDGDEQYIEDAANDYDLPREAVEAAFAYYHRHRAFIDVRIAQNLA